jgi:hypothetical protein
MYFKIEMFPGTGRCFVLGTRLEPGKVYQVERVGHCDGAQEGAKGFDPPIGGAGLAYRLDGHGPALYVA